MEEFVDTLKIGTRLVQVKVLYPRGRDVLNVLELAETAMRSVNKEITIHGVTCTVQDLGEA